MHRAAIAPDVAPNRTANSYVVEPAASLRTQILFDAPVDRPRLLPVGVNPAFLIDQL